MQVVEHDMVGMSRRRYNHIGDDVGEHDRFHVGFERRRRRCRRAPAAQVGSEAAERGVERLEMLIECVIR